MSDEENDRTPPGELPPERSPRKEVGTDAVRDARQRPLPPEDARGRGGRNGAASAGPGGSSGTGGTDTPNGAGRSQGGPSRPADRAGGAPEGEPEPPQEPRAETAAGTGTGPGPEAAAEAPGGDSAGHDRPRPAGLTGRQRLVKAVWPPRVTRAQLTVALLLFVLGLGLAIQVRSTSENSALRGARQEDLVRILDELDNRTKRLEDEKQGLERQRTELESSSDQAEEARKQTRQKERQLGVLAGTVAAEGTGIELKINDKAGTVESDMLLDTVQELRAAGAEAIEVNDVRVVADTYFSDGDGGVKVDGHKISQPYVFEVIGKPQDLEPALNIPGGVVQTLRKEQATASVTRSGTVTVDALRSAKRPDYARSSSQ